MSYTTTPTYEYRRNGGAWDEKWAPNAEVRTILAQLPLKALTLNLENGDTVEWRIQPVPYYVNLGRWAGNVVGPFDTYHEADSYIDRIDWKGSRPTVVQVARPEK